MPSRLDDENTDPPVLLRVQDAARMVSLSQSRIYNLLLSGDIPAFRFGRAVRIPRKDLLEWVAKHTGPYTPQGPEAGEEEE